MVSLTDLEESDRAVVLFAKQFENGDSEEKGLSGQNMEIEIQERVIISYASITEAKNKIKRTLGQHQRNPPQRNAPPHI